MSEDNDVVVEALKRIESYRLAGMSGEPQKIAREALPIARQRAKELQEATELARLIHQRLKRGEQTQDHGLIMNLKCSLNHLTDF